RLAEVLFDLGDVEASYDEFARVFASQSYFTSKVDDESKRVLLLFAPLPWRMNTRFDFLISTMPYDVLYITSDDVLDAIDATRYERIVSCIGAHDIAREARERLTRWIRRSGIHVSNPPEAVEALSRTSLCASLHGLSGFSTAPTTRVARNALAEGAFPMIIRPPDSQAGRGLARLTGPADLMDYLRDHDDPEFDVSSYVEYCSDDGFYRKYRIVIIDGVAYPYHLAISQNWMVHYLTSDMSSDVSHRDEEAAFLADPFSHIPNFATRFSSLATHLGLEYCTLDCTVIGEMIFVFEIDPTMLIHVREDDRIFAYRVPYVANIAKNAQKWLCREGRKRL
ncbi:MAG: ATP-grasp domain-containing protein, partial [Vulcanimicrobiaceae bacterium]